MIDTDTGYRAMNRYTLKAFTRQVLAELDETYELVFVDYRDQLTDDQIDSVMRDDNEGLFESTADFEMEQTYNQSKYEAETLARDIADRWGRTFNVDADELYDLWLFGAGFDEVRETISQRNTGDWLQQLADQSGTVLMRHILRGEDDSLYGGAWPNLTATDTIKWLNEGCEPGTRFKRNKRNVEVVRGVLAEAFHAQAYLMGMLVYAVRVGDILRMPADGYVEITNPHLYLGNYYHGDGMCDGPLDATIRVKREDMHTDKGAPGYGWDEVAGVYTSAYETEIKHIPADTKEN